MDTLATFLDLYRLQARQFYAGELCGEMPGVYGGDVSYVHILRSGRLKLKPVGSEIIMISTPSVIFLPAVGKHGLEGALEDPAQLICATIEYGGSGAWLMGRYLPGPMIVPLAENNVINFAASMIAEEVKGRCSGWHGAIDGLFAYLATQLIRSALAATHKSNSASGDPEYARVGPALAAIEKKPELRWTVANLADECGMSRALFAQKFHAALGITPMEYLTSFRLSIAKDMLRRGNSVAAAAKKLGFSGLASFTRAFSRAEGMPPTIWLKRRSQQE